MHSISRKRNTFVKIVRMCIVWRFVEKEVS